MWLHIQVFILSTPEHTCMYKRENQTLTNFHPNAIHGANRQKGNVTSRLNNLQGISHKYTCIYTTHLFVKNVHVTINENSMPTNFNTQTFGQPFQKMNQYLPYTYIIYITGIVLRNNWIQKYWHIHTKQKKETQCVPASFSTQVKVSYTVTVRGIS